MASSADAKAKKKHQRRASHSAHKAHTVEVKTPVKGQSVGAPWDGSLHDAAKFPAGDGYKIRRPWRAFGTRTTVAIVKSVVTGVRAEFPEQHVLAIGDFSAEKGGAITQHRSHQSGRDVDIGLFYKEKPANYPTSFVKATTDNLDCEATFALVERFASTSGKDGGVQMMFLDYNVQGLLVKWAKDHGVDDDKLGAMFQYGHGRGSSSGLVHHEPGHDNHLHVRFKCPKGDTACKS
jgi:murein endopeptidase